MGDSQAPRGITLAIQYLENTMIRLDMPWASWLLKGFVP